MEQTTDSPAPDGRAAGDEVVSISRSELDALRAVAAGLAPIEGAGGPAGAPPRPASARDAGPAAEQEFAARDRRLAELEAACKVAVREKELATALAGKALVGGAASQLIKLWGGEFDVYEEEGRFKVACRDGRAVGQAVNEWLASPEYAHFCLPASRGGTGARDANRPAGGAAPRGVPKTLGEVVVMRWREESAAQPNNLLKPIGLRRDR